MNFYQTERVWNQRMQSGWKNWAKSTDYDAVAGSITFKPHLKDKGSLTHKKASEALENFRRRLNRKAYGSAARVGRARRAKSLGFIPVLEGDGDAFNHHLHYHLLIERPAHIDMSSWVQTCHEVWQKVEWASRDQNRFIPAHDRDGWIDYMFKFRSKKSITECVELGALNIN